MITMTGPYKIDFTSGKLEPVKDDGLNIGQILWLNGYGQSKHYHEKQVIYKITDGRFGRQYHTVNIDKSTLSVKDHPQNETKLHGIGTYYTEGDIFTGDIQAEVDKAIENELNLKNQAVIDAEIAANKRAKDLQSLKQTYKHLILLEDSKLSGPALGAKNLRSELKKAFPLVKFSVTSSSYSMGCSISIHWTGGPTTEAVEAISNDYQYCDFDGMQDIETYRDNIFSDLFGGAKYVQTSRNLTNEMYQATAADMGYKDAVFYQGSFVGLDRDIDDMIRREAWTRTY